MKRLLALTLFALLTISCSRGNSSVANSSKGSTMTYSVNTQAELDEANKRINEYKQELLRQGFHEVSVAFSDKTVSTTIVDEKEQVVLEGQYGTLRDLRVTLWTSKWLQKDQQPQLGGRVHASLRDEQAERDFDELYKKVAFVVTGQAQ
jgi:hypothetical protein